MTNRRESAGGLRGLCPARLVAVMLALAIAASSARAAEPLRGVVRAINEAALSTDVPMRVIRLPFRQGHAFDAGEVLAEFDCRRNKAELQAAAGAVREAEVNLEANIKLDGYKAIGKQEIEISRARLEKALGERRIIEARIEDCLVRAPFAGRVSERLINVWEFTAAQRPYLSIIEEGNLEIELIVSSGQISSLSVGQKLSYVVDEIRASAGDAIINAVNPTVDPVSKTGRITAQIVSAPAALSIGMTVTAIVGAPAEGPAP